MGSDLLLARVNGADVVSVIAATSRKQQAADAPSRRANCRIQRS
ncbi:hypothetical protein R1521_23895 [Rhizobium brockwellii]|jgi:hypothetical protein|uniref:Uncharacterized protein n=2 Tax=Rhizobium/Agrobacterium group TaxID=227290 RepID=A0ABU3YSG4_9HYPH|nr:hypothetical protein [Rhizobium brockwellii]MDV4181545.1 hypothetical protein [Rhizobium brockwellii]MDV4188692.1 hypothetical protein [Rhizobium brockwellii]